MDKEIEELSELFKKTLDECHRKFLDYLHNGCKQTKVEEVRLVNDNDIGKLCRFWDDNVFDYNVGLLEIISEEEGDTDCPYCMEGGYGCWYKHCRLLTPSEVEEITGYKVEVG